MDIRRIATVDEAIAVLSELGDDAQVLAGGTDVMIQLKRDEISPSTLVPIEPLSDLRNVSTNNGVIRVGTLVTHETLASGQLGTNYESVKEAAARVGGWQTQTVGTLGGNVCNASPAADTLPPLLVHEARVELLSKDGSREMPLDDFLLGRRQTARRPDELLTSVILPPTSDRSGDAYVKVGRRKAMEIAIVGYAMHVEFSSSGEIEKARIALASVASVPLRAKKAESILEGRKPTNEIVNECAEELVEEVSPIDDVRGSAQYRKRLIPGLTRRALIRSAARAGVEVEVEELAA